MSHDHSETTPQGATEDMSQGATEHLLYCRVCNSGAFVSLWQVEMGGWWWDSPSEMSAAITAAKAAGSTHAVYTWDWDTFRPGAWRPNDEETSISRYEICFATMLQRNIDNERQRRVRLAWVEPASPAA